MPPSAVAPMRTQPTAAHTLNPRAALLPTHAGTNWDGSSEREALRAALDERLAALRSERITACVGRVEKAMGQLTSGPVLALLDTCAPGVWPRLHGVCRDAAASAEKQLMQVGETGAEG